MITKNNYYLEIAKTISCRSTCLRSKVGAVLVKNDCIITVGYNGSPRNEQSCYDLGYCNRKDYKSGEGYNLCIAIHAENNCIVNLCRVGGCSTIGSTMYIYEQTTNKNSTTLGPCKSCERILKNCGIENVIFKKEIIN